MHYRLFITLPKAAAMNSETARSIAESYLTENHFAGSGERFSDSPADWFQVGGRWSGILSRTLLEKEFCERVDAAFKQEGGDYFMDLKNDEHSRILQMERAFKKVLKEQKRTWPTNLHNPFWRDSRANFDGCEDDAVILTATLYDALLKEFEPHAQDGQASITGDIGWIDTEFSTLSPALIENSWIVVIDYHN